MKSHFLSFLLAGAFCFCLPSCDDEETPQGENSLVNDGKVHPEIVFTGELPKQIGNMKMTYDKNGFLTQIEEESTNVTYEYLDGSRSDTPKKVVRMTITYKDYPADKNVLNLILGENGFVKECFETEYYGNGTPEEEYWAFKYDKAGYLIEMKRSEGGNEITTMTYNKDGDLVSTSMTDEEGSIWKSTINYVSDTVTEPIDNKGCIMCYDITFDVDMDEMNYAFYAGLLGKATSHLPINSTETFNIGGSQNTQHFTYHWEMNSNGYPIKLTAIEKDNIYGGDEETFQW